MYKKFYAVKNINEKERIISSSGGVFLSIAKEVIKENGIVYGAIYNSSLEVTHSRADNYEELIKMTGSKYSQSKLKDIILKIKEDLESGKRVLFVGTPCQVNYIKTIAKNNNDNLITIDLVCHGTPEKKFLKDYIIFQEKKYNSKISKINMRYKDEKIFNKNLNKKYIPISNVQPKCMKIDFENGESYVERSNFDPYYQLFDLLIKKGCFKCPFASLDRVGDVTIGDFHEFNSKLGEFNDGNGISLVIVNTKKGKLLIKKINNVLNILPKRKKECLQPALIEPTKMPENYDEFQNDYENYGFSYVVKKYTQSGIKYIVKRLLYKIGLFDLLKRIHK